MNRVKARGRRGGRVVQASLFPAWNDPGVETRTTFPDRSRPPGSAIGEFHVPLQPDPAGDPRGSRASSALTPGLV